MEVVIVTGLSGAGKTQAMNCLEDLGFFCIDNMPPALTDSVLRLAQAEGNDIDKIALAQDLRGRKFFSDIAKTLKSLDNQHINYKVIYLEAADSILIRRYNETRRSHPLSKSGNVREGIAIERKLLEDIRKRADYIIDTQNLKRSQLLKRLSNILSEDKLSTFSFNISSFGYKKGIPAEADVVVDVRFIPNPYYVKSLKNLTGNNRKVQNYVMRHDITKFFIKSFIAMIEGLVDAYQKEGKYSLNIAFGCTGGQHRSVTLANEVAGIFERGSYHVNLEHRDL